MKNKSLINVLEKSQALLAGKKVTAGFDGFVDTIVKVIKEKKENKTPVYFKTTRQFGKYITDKQGSSFSLEVEEISSRIGGNMPILANGLGHLGIMVNCVGAMGFPVSHPVFAGLSPNCKVYSFIDPGLSTAYEFTDGKILLGQNGLLNTAGWNFIKEKIGLQKLIDLYQSGDLLCFVNWSEIDSSTDIWKGILYDVLPNYTSREKKQTAFFDLSDCSKRSVEVIREAMELFIEFSKYAKVVLGLNHNEARLIYEALHQKKAPKEFRKIGEKIFHKLGIDTLVLHSSKQAIGFNATESVTVRSFFVKSPLISTGAGDNFNAGFCTALLLELDLEKSLTLANAVAGNYVSSGKSGTMNDVIKFLQHAH